MVSVAASDPTKAAIGMPRVLLLPNRSESITANPAPELTPIVFGLARELFMTLCKITPAVESPMPATHAPTALGSRTV